MIPISSTVRILVFLLNKTFWLILVRDFLQSFIALKYPNKSMMPVSNNPMRSDRWKH